MMWEERGVDCSVGAGIHWSSSGLVEANPFFGFCWRLMGSGGDSGSGGVCEFTSFCGGTRETINVFMTKRLFVFNIG